MGFGVWGLGFGVWGLGCRVWGVGFRGFGSSLVETAQAVQYLPGLPGECHHGYVRPPLYDAKGLVFLGSRGLRFEFWVWGFGVVRD